jgi:large subunit ribosomal protein L31
MKPGIHPEYRSVVFRDRSAGESFLTRSTVTTDRTVEWTDGKTYPLVEVDVSAYSHPFYTGKQRLLDSAGRVERFRAKYAKK